MCGVVFPILKGGVLLLRMISLADKFPKIGEFQSKMATLLLC